MIGTPLVSSTVVTTFCVTPWVTVALVPPFNVTDIDSGGHVVKYPAEAGGYTPGDTWDLYVGKDNRIQYMVYHRGGPKKPSLVNAKWAGYKSSGPLLFSTDHPGTADGKPLHLVHAGVAVKLAGSDKWVEAK